MGPQGSPASGSQGPHVTEVAGIGSLDGRACVFRHSVCLRVMSVEVCSFPTSREKGPAECMQLHALNMGADGTWAQCVLNGPWARTLDVPRVQAASVLPGCPIHVLF